MSGTGGGGAGRHPMCRARPHRVASALRGQHSGTTTYAANRHKQAASPLAPRPASGGLAAATQKGMAGSDAMREARQVPRADVRGRSVLSGMALPAAVRAVPHICFAVTGNSFSVTVPNVWLISVKTNGPGRYVS